MLSGPWGWRVSCVLSGPCVPGPLGTGLRGATCEIFRMLCGPCRGTEGLQVKTCSILAFGQASPLGPLSGIWNSADSAAFHLFMLNRSFPPECGMLFISAYPIPVFTGVLG